MTSNVELGRQIESVVDSLVEAGRYKSVSEGLRESVRLVQEREAKLPRWIQLFYKEWQILMQAAHHRLKKSSNG